LLDKHLGHNDFPDGAGTSEMKRSESGQVLVLFALFAVVLLGFVALAIDVSRVYAQESYQRTVSDAAALAGAQDLFQEASRDVPTGGPDNARQHAMDVLVSRLGTTRPPPSCYYDGVAPKECNLPGTPYWVWITTPSPTCVACDPNRSVQVTVKYESFGLTFARVFGQNQWDISTTSVAGITTSIRYSMVTLRPSYSPSGRKDSNDQNRKDISLPAQNTYIHIENGDVGTNTSVDEQLTPVGTPPLCGLQLDTGFSVYHLSTYDTWCTTGTPPGPRGIQIQTPIPDPGYVTDARFGQIEAWLQANRTQSYSTQHADAVASCNGVTGAPSVAGLTTYCYQPGYYAPPNGQTAFSVGTGELAYLVTGTYFFNGNVTIQGPGGGKPAGMLVGGDASSGTGVALLFPSTNATMTSAAGVGVSLNMGDATCTQDSCRATAPMDTPYSPLVGLVNLPLTVVVQRNPLCFTGLVPTDGSCSDSNVVNLSGGANLAIAGIVYAPSDHITVTSQPGSQTGTTGLIISWRVTYNGNTSLNQAYPGLFESGVLRIDAACTKGSPAMPCNAP
jgi:hypothetical protein